MQLAVSAARRAEGRTGPNPPVGCAVTDQSGRLVAVGHTARGGRPHATRLCWQSPDNRFRDLGPSPVEGEAAAPPLPLGAPPGGLPRRIVGRRPAMTPRATLAGRLAG